MVEMRKGLLGTPMRPLASLLFSSFNPKTFLQGESSADSLHAEQSQDRNKDTK